MKQFLNVIIILSLPLIVLMAYALSDVNFPYQPDKIDLSAILSRTDNDGGKMRKQTDKDTLAVDSAKQRILFFGDSMLEGLAPRLSQWAKASGHELTYVCWYSSSTKLWATTDTLARFIHNTSPTYILICLGTNEQFVNDLSKREEYISTILSTIGSTPYVWICPPAWKKDTGINELIRQRVGQKRFFDSRRLTFKRGADHVHPIFSSSKAWMDSVVVWMQSNATAHPVMFRKPQSNEKVKCRSYYLFNM